MDKINVGDRVRDKISGFQGIVIAVTEYLYGCRRATVQPEVLHENKPIDAFFFDEPQLEVTLRGAIRRSTKVEKEPGGAIHSIPTARSIPSR